MLDYNIIVAVDSNNGISKEDNIPWHIPNELKYFKKITTNTEYPENMNIIIMGRKTWESINSKPLKGRINIVISKKIKATKEENTYICPSVEETFKLIKEFDNYEKIFVIGGEQLYNHFLKEYPSYCSLIYRTVINKDFECDKFFNIPDDFTSIKRSEEFKCRRTLLRYNYEVISHETNNYELGYLNLLENIIDNGMRRSNRTDTDTLSIFGSQLRFSLENGVFPLLTTKKMYLRPVFEELMFFLRGDTNVGHLKEKKVNIWNGNSTREFLDSRGLTHYEENDIGPCFIGNTAVLTDTGYKKIQRVTKYDLLYTHTGEWYKIIDIYKNFYSGEMYKFNLQLSSKPLVVTPEHPFYTYNKGWVPAKDLDDHIIGIKINEHSNDIEGITDPLLYVLMGYYLTNGWITHDSIYLHVDFQQFDRVHEVIQKLNIEHIKMDYKTKTHVLYVIKDKLLLKVFSKFGKFSFIKHVPSEIHDLPVDKIEKFIEGVETMTNRHITHDLCLSIQLLYAKIGVLTSIRYNKGRYRKIIGIDDITKSYYYTFIPSSKGFIKDGYLWQKPRKKEKINDFKGYVYNFNVVVDHSYIVEGVSVHNCYGYQWRHFDAPYEGMNADYTGKGVDQLKYCVDLIRDNPTSRRILFHAWNPKQLDEMALPCCHLLYQFYVDTENNKLKCHMYQRSQDTFLGLPFNIASTALLVVLIAKLTDLEPSEIIISGGDSHIYVNHIDQVKEQIKRKPFSFPKIKINKEFSTIEELEQLKFTDIEITDYESHKRIKGKMAI